jgi:hypothetical protein
MVTSRQLHKLATSPSAHLKFMTTGELPRGTRPQGPLVDLLSAISPRDRAAIRGLKVDETLGYQGSRVFGSAEQAFRWIHPDREVFGSFPADSWRMKGRLQRLHIDDVLEKAAGFPEGLADRYPQLRRPVRPQQAPQASSDAAEAGEAGEPIKPRAPRP